MSVQEVPDVVPPPSSEGGDPTPAKSEPFHSPLSNEVNTVLAAVGINGCANAQELASAYESKFSKTIPLESEGRTFTSVEQIVESLPDVIHRTSSGRLVARTLLSSRALDESLVSGNLLEFPQLRIHHELRTTQSVDLETEDFAIVGRPMDLAGLDYATVIQPRIGSMVSKQLWDACLKQLNPTESKPTSAGSSNFLRGTRPSTVPLYLNKAFAIALPTRFTRDNAPSGSALFARTFQSLGFGRVASSTLIFVVPPSAVLSLVSAISRTLPKFSIRSSRPQHFNSKSVINIEVQALPEDSTSCECIDYARQNKDEKLAQNLDSAALRLGDVQWLEVLGDCVRNAARIVDTPANIMTTTQFVKEAQYVAKCLPGVSYNVISGDELRTQGFGGIYNVGKASLCPPALVVLSHCPEGATKTVAWVGKGIVYDTGGMQMKTKSTMPGMKKDCGGAAAVLHAFRAAVLGNFSQRLHAVLCLAENNIGAVAMRPDDIIVMKSGKTVEVNNTDAEGRLVLGDGVFHAARTLGADVIVDVATLTGAQRITTGDHHGAVLTNSDCWERLTCSAARASGDLIFPMVYCPELHFPELACSPVADMKNSLVGRASTAASSIAGLFIHAQINFDPAIPWIHVDMAQPVAVSERATGYGVALLNQMFGSWMEVGVAKQCAPKLPC